MEALQDMDPRHIGSYTLLGRLAADGMGQAFLGRSVAGRPVTIKVIRPDLAADPGFRVRLAREANAARRVGAFTAPVIDVNADAPLPWLVTAYVDGPSLATVVASHGPLPARSVLTLAAGLAEVLSAAHSVGVVHHDLTPASVLLAPDGPRLIDFGISRAVDRWQLAARAGTLPGTPGFMSPEQAEGLEAGPASDMFSLGAVLLFAATGTLMYYFAGHLNQLPGELRPFIERCMAVDPARRPTASEFLTELTAAHPDAVNHVAWLPGGILAAGTGSSGGRPAQVVAPAPAGPQTLAPFGSQAPPAPLPVPVRAETIALGAGKHAQERRPRRMARIGRLPAALKKSRHVRIMAIIALAFAVAGAGIVYVIHPWPYPLLRPTGLAADQRGANSISLGWSNPASGPLPDKYVILRDGAVAATVPGNVNHFKDGGLAPATTYNFRVIAYRGRARSQSSLDVRAATQTPPLSEAVLSSPFTVTEKVESGASSVSGVKNGDTYHDVWQFTSNCTIGPCVMQVGGAVDGENFTAELKPDGDGTYTGTAHINDYYYCGDSTSNTTDSTLVITVSALAAQAAGIQWQASKISGNVVWNIDANPNGNCGSGMLIIGFHG
jgi:hypothetical protein